MVVENTLATSLDQPCIYMRLIVWIVTVINPRYNTAYRKYILIKDFPYILKRSEFLEYFFFYTDS